MKQSFLKHVCLGLLIGLLVIPPQYVQAQWTVFDPTQYALQVKKRLEEINRWVETVRQYQEMYTKAVEQLTTLRGVLQTVDKTLFKNQQMALLANDIGKIISDSLKLKRRLESMIRYQIVSLKSIDDRLSNGIFDPDADLRDLQNYLLYTMGRDARQTVAQMVRAAHADAQLATWIDEKQKLEAERATMSDKIINLQKQLKLEDAQTPEGAINIQHLNEMIMQCELRIDDLTKRIAELTEKINQRIREYGLRLEDMENFGHEVLSTTEMWRELQKTKDDLQRTLDGLVLGANPPPPAE